MTHKLWLKKPILSYSGDVFDIVQFGSTVVEESTPNDLDIAVIFNKIPLKDQLDQSQEMKRQIQALSDLPIHIISFDLYRFFESSNFSRENILWCGKSLITGASFSEKFGLVPTIQVYYSLKGLDKKGKVRFHYMLNGKHGEYGLLRKYNGSLLKPGLIEILPEHEQVFVESIKKFEIPFHLKKILS